MTAKAATATDLGVRGVAMPGRRERLAVILVPPADEGSSDGACTHLRVSRPCVIGASCHPGQRIWGAGEVKIG
ncbi:hypothetical protein GCM10023324_42560 [Streptomyces youssoufiensis]